MSAPVKCPKCGKWNETLDYPCWNCGVKHSFAPAPGSAHWHDEYDWPCDTYQYQNRCVLCAVVFVGDKRRAVCRKCATQAENLPPMSAPNAELRHGADSNATKENP